MRIDGRKATGGNRPDWKQSHKLAGSSNASDASGRVVVVEMEINEQVSEVDSLGPGDGLDGRSESIWRYQE